MAIAMQHRRTGNTIIDTAVASILCRNKKLTSISLYSYDYIEAS